MKKKWRENLIHEDVNLSWESHLFQKVETELKKNRPDKNRGWWIQLCGSVMSLVLFVALGVQNKNYKTENIEIINATLQDFTSIEELEDLDVIENLEEIEAFILLEEV